MDSIYNGPNLTPEIITGIHSYKFKVLHLNVKNETNKTQLHEY